MLMLENPFQEKVSNLYLVWRIEGKQSCFKFLKEVTDFFSVIQQLDENKQAG